MAQIDLLFSQLPVAGQPVEIVFGADEDTPTVATDAYIAGTLPQPALYGTLFIGPVVSATIAATLPQPALDALLDVRQVYVVALAGTIAQPILLADLQAEYRSNTERPTVGQALTPWTPCNPLQNGAQDRSQGTAATPSGTAPRWQHAVATPASATAPMANALRTPVSRSTRFEQGVPYATRAVALHQDAQRAVRNLLRDAFANAERAQTQPITQRHQDGIRDRRPSRETGWQVANGIPPKGYASRQGPAGWLNKGYTPPHQNAMRPPAGIYVPPGPAQPDPCYLPTLPAHLVFEALWSADTNLVFVCERRTPPPDPQPGETIVVPIRRVYVTINSAVLVRLDNGHVIPTTAMTMSIDVDSWTWGFSASVPGSALADVHPNGNGDPVVAQATINGTAFRFTLERVSRDRTFNSSQLRVSGRGIGAELDAPYAPQMAFGNTGARTAQQLLGDILTFNGVPIGWGIGLWQPTDWLVPAGVFNHNGTYISALNAVVGAAGAYLQPHNTDRTLDVRLRYPTPAWTWASVTPNFELPADVTTQEGFEWVDKPVYNRVFVTGQEHGVNGRYTRAGTAGDLLAPPVIDPLITHADAARQRGRAIISDTGRIATVTLRMPVRADTGIIKPGNFVRYTEGGNTHVGITRGVSVAVAMPTIYQTLTVETHVEPI